MFKLCDIASADFFAGPGFPLAGRRGRYSGFTHAIFAVSDIAGCDITSCKKAITVVILLNTTMEFRYSRLFQVEQLAYFIGIYWLNTWIKYYGG